VTHEFVPIADEQTPEGKVADKVIYQPTCGLISPGGLIDQVYNPETGKVAFATFVVKDGSRGIVSAKGIKYGDRRFVPLKDDLIFRGVVRLPQCSTPYGTQHTLVAELESHIRRYVVLPNATSTSLLAAYVLFTWVYDRFQTAPYLRFIGDFGSGKSTAAQVIGDLCFRAIVGQGNASPATLYRVLEQVGGGTLVLDETDFNLKNYADQEKMMILRSGYQRYTSTVLKQVPIEGSAYRTQAFSAFGPKILAGRSNFPDAALESRCIRVVMQSSAEMGNVPHERPEEYEHQALQLRNKLLHWRQDHFFKALRDVEPIADVEGRMLQLYIPLAQLIEDVPTLEALRGMVVELQADITDARYSSKEACVASALVIEWNRAPGHGRKKVHVARIATVASMKIVGQFGVGEAYTSRDVCTTLRAFGMIPERDSEGRFVVYHPREFESVMNKYGVALPGDGGSQSVDGVDNVAA